MKGTTFFGVITAVIFTILLVLYAVSSAGCKKDRRKESNQADSETTQKNNESKNSAVKSSGNKQQPDSHENASHQSNLTGLNRIPPGKRIAFRVTLDANEAGQEPRQWTGQFTVRAESQLSTITLKRKRLDQGSRPAKTVQRQS